MSKNEYVIARDNSTTIKDNKEWGVDTAPGTSNLYSFPFWLIIDAKNPPSTQEITVKNNQYRFYPPFRSAPANFTGMPEIKPSAIPFSPGTKPNMPANLKLITIAATPSITSDGKKPHMVLNWGEKWDENVISLAMDSMRIDWFRDDKEQNVGQLLRQLFDQLRWMSNQWWIGHSVEALSGYLRNQFGIKKNGTPVELPIGRTSAYGVGTDVIPITNDMWELAFKNIATDLFPPSYRILFLDAQHSLAAGDLRTFSVRAATACEQAIDFHFERLWQIHRSGKYKKGKICQGYEIDKHISQDLNKFINKSFEIDDPISFELIADLWDARGNVAHGKALIFRKDGVVQNLTQDKGANMIAGIKSLMAWLENLN